MPTSAPCLIISSVDAAGIMFAAFSSYPTGPPARAIFFLSFSLRSTASLMSITNLSASKLTFVSVLNTASVMKRLRDWEITPCFLPSIAT